MARKHVTSPGVVLSRSFNLATDSLAVLQAEPKIKYIFARPIGADTNDPDPISQEPEESLIIRQSETASVVFLAATTGANCVIWVYDGEAGWLKAAAVTLSAYEEQGPYMTRWRSIFVQVLSAQGDGVLFCGCPE